MQMSEQRENAGVLTRSLEEENSRADSTDFPHDLEEITTFVTKVAWPSIWFRQPIPEQLFLSEMTSSHLCAKELVLHLSRYHILSNLGRTYEVLQNVCLSLNEKGVATWYMTKEARVDSGERQSLQRMVSGTLESYMQRNKTGSLPYTTPRSQLEMD